MPAFVQEDADYVSEDCRFTRDEPVRAHGCGSLSNGIRNKLIAESDRAVRWVVECIDLITLRRLKDQRMRQAQRRKEATQLL
jgi:hypothetical protein